jgi:hypothetical protein
MIPFPSRNIEVDRAVVVGDLHHFWEPTRKSMLLLAQRRINVNVILCRSIESSRSGSSFGMWLLTKP